MEGARAGGHVGPYRVEEVLGSGGPRATVRAVDESTGLSVALKAVPDRVRHDADVLAQLGSRHVVRVLAVVEQDGSAHVVSEFLPDGDLGSFLRARGPLDPRRSLALVTQLAEALEDAHGAGVLHRDLKPANVLLRHRGSDTLAYLGDFGVADEPGPTYTAPEVERGAPASPASDLYALGVLLHACLTGVAPLEPLAGGVVVPGSMARAVPVVHAPAPAGRLLNGLLGLLLADDPDRRFASATAARVATRAALRVLEGRAA